MSKIADNTCGKCGVTYEDMDVGFYFKDGRGYAKPCKKCISAYNKTEEQRKRRNEYNRKYFKRIRAEDKKAGKRYRYDHRPRVGDAKRNASRSTNR